MKIFRRACSHCLNTTSDNWIPRINVNPDDVEDSPMAIHNRHKVIIPSRFLTNIGKNINN